MNHSALTKLYICSIGIYLLAAMIAPTANGQSLVARGEAAFNQSCLQCHDTDRVFQKRKSPAGWLATVRRMASLDEADIPSSTHIAIAAYLSSRDSPNPEPPQRQPAPRPPRRQSDQQPPSRQSGTLPAPIRDPARDSNRRNAANGTGESGDTNEDSDSNEAGDSRSATNDDEDADSRSASSDDEDQDSSQSVDDDDPDRNDANSKEDDDSLWDDLSNEVGSGLSTSGTISPLWRNGNDNLENPNFFVDAWLRADWQPNGPLRARVTACTSCHSDATSGSGFTLELAEAYVAFDLTEYIQKPGRSRNPHCRPQTEAELRAGRFIVPFGAYASQSHPGSYGAVTAPLLFNMGRRVNPDNARVPVLPQPFSDEGFDLNVKLRYKELIATFDVYGINGLQGFGPGIQFTPSRDYTDNNSNVTVGTRATIGTKNIRVGGSVMSGQLQDELSPILNFNLTGADVTARFFDDQLRFNFEYAIRRNDSVFGQRQIAYGTVTEIDALLVADPNIRMLARYDTIEHRDFFGSQGIRRFTWGFSTASIGGSTLIINHEHWRFSGSDPDTDLVGIRWVSVF